MISGADPKGRWTKEKLQEFIYGDDEEMSRLMLVEQLTSHMTEETAEEEFDCPIHGKLGGIDECPRC